MKKILVVLLILGITIPCFGAIVSTQGEQKIAVYLRQIHSQVESTKESITRIYNSAKTYIQDHPTQFQAEDKTKLTNLQVKITELQNAVLNLMTEIETSFQGINE